MNGTVFTDTGTTIRRARIIGGVALVVAIIGALFDPAGFFRAYLWTFWFLLGIALGSLGVVMVHHLTGGAWGFVVRRILEAAMMTIPLLALMCVPVLLAAPLLYPWAAHAGGIGAADPKLAEAIRQKAAYLNVPFVAVRALVYFGAWYGIARVVRGWSVEQDRTGDPRITTRFQHFCGPAIFAYVVLVSLASVDWVMSIEPQWYSTMYGFIVVTGQGLSALAWATFVAARLMRFPTALRENVGPENLWDVGSLTFSFLLLWAYTSFGQFLVIWCGNIGDEALYYVHRGVAGWAWVGVFLMVFAFFCPFVALIFGGVKRRPATLGAVAAFLVFVRMVDAVWMVKPGFGVPQGNVSWFDLLVPVALGGIWVSAFVSHLGRAPLIPLRDPRIETPPEAEIWEAPSNA